MTSPDARRVSPAFARNRSPILEVLRQLWTPKTDPLRVLELASGPGQHALDFAQALPHTAWQPTDANAALLPSIDAWNADQPNVAAAVKLNVCTDPWPQGPFDAALAINFFHMVDLRTINDALAGCAAALRPGATLAVYDCFTYDGVHVSDSNARFDAHLKAHTPGGGVHEFNDVNAAALKHGLGAPQIHRLPANNQLVVWTRQAT